MPAATPAKRARQWANKAARNADSTIPATDAAIPESPLHSNSTMPSDAERPDEYIPLDELLTRLANCFELQDPVAGPVIAEAFRSGVRGGCTLATQRFKARYDELDEQVHAFIVDYEARLEEFRNAAYEQGIADERARWEAQSTENQASASDPEPRSSPTTTTAVTAHSDDEPVPDEHDLSLLTPNQRIIFKRGHEHGYGRGINFVLERMLEKNAEAIAGVFEEGRKVGWTQAQENMMPQRQQDTDYAFKKGLEAGRLEARGHPQENNNPACRTMQV